MKVYIIDEIFIHLMINQHIVIVKKYIYIYDIYIKKEKTILIVN